MHFLRSCPTTQHNLSHITQSRQTEREGAEHVIAPRKAFYCQSLNPAAFNLPWATFIPGRPSFLSSIDRLFGAAICIETAPEVYVMSWKKGAPNVSILESVRVHTRVLPNFFGNFAPTLYTRIGVQSWSIYYFSHLLSLRFF